MLEQGPQWFGKSRTIHKKEKQETFDRATKRHLPYIGLRLAATSNTGKRARFNPSQTNQYLIYILRWDEKLSWPWPSLFVFAEWQHRTGLTICLQFVLHVLAGGGERFDPKPPLLLRVSDAICRVHLLKVSEFIQRFKQQGARTSKVSDDRQNYWEMCRNRQNRLRCKSDST